MHSLDQFAKKSYLNLETFHKSGESMKTPVWFVQEGDLLYIRTLANSGKVKRIRNNPRVNVVPCGMGGKPHGTWAPALAQRMHDPQLDQKVDHLLDKKYGLMRKVFSMRSRGPNQTYITLEVKLSE